MSHRRDDPFHHPPWSTAGGPDEAYDDGFRRATLSLLTDPQLEALYPGGGADYDDMVRALQLVWECGADGTVNAVGHRCARCGAGRADTATR
jgi:hypothetical protein